MNRKRGPIFWMIAFIGLAVVTILYQQATRYFAPLLAGTLVQLIPIEGLSATVVSQACSSAGPAVLIIVGVALNVMSRRRRARSSTARHPMDGKSIVKAGYNQIARAYSASRDETQDDVTGVDFSEEQIKLARANVPHATFVCEDMTALAFADASFDAIVSHYAIIHILRDEHAGLFANFQRMLKPGGFALLGLGGDDLDDDIEEDYFGARMYWSHFDANTSADMVRAAGFEIVTETLVPDPDSGYHLYVLGRKGAT